MYYISMVEAIANSLEDALIDGLSIKLGKTASYIKDRRSCSFHLQGSNIYAPTNLNEPHKGLFKWIGLVRSNSISYNVKFM